MEQDLDLFTREQTRIAIQKFLSRLEVVKTEDDFEAERNNHLRLILTNMVSHPQQWNDNCMVNLKWIGNQFVSMLSDQKNNEKDYLDDVFSTCFRYLLELYFTVKGELTIEYERARRFASDNFDKFSEHSKRSIAFAMQDMPINILKSLLTSEKIDNIKDFNNIAKAADEMKNDWNKEIERKTQEVNQLKENLDKYKAAFNFVGLHQGFDELALIKQKEKTNILNWLVFFGCLIVLPVLSEITFIFANFDKAVAAKSTLLLLSIPIISLVAILVYYFRILLFHFNSIKSQLLQLELRKSLCRFIQNYVDYSTEIKKKDKDALIKFENVIFSGIVSSDEKLPSTFDGIDQLANLVKSVKS